MTQEEKAKRYDEALERAKNTIEVNQAIPDIVECVESLFPELAESEDEVVRKELIKGISKTRPNTLFLDTNITREDALAWLEKQGEHANFRNKIQIGDKVTRNEDGVLVNLSQLKRVAKPADKVEPKFKVGDEIKTANEESLTITKIDEKGYWSEDLFICGFEEECIWDLVEQKPAWNEEDERLFDSVVWNLRYSVNNRDIEHSAGQLEDWLKSLKERYTWKPSDEQIELLQAIVSNPNNASLEGCQMVLKDIIKQLKKLREE